jgi:3-keto-disaccharide hydrolase
MKRSLAVFLLLAVSALAGCAHPAGPAAGGGWITLLDGKTLENWNRIGDANWRIEDGAAVADAGNGFLVTKQTFGDFELRAEFYVDENANSGVFIRCSDPKKPASATGYEVNIFDKRPDPSYGTGAIVGVAKAQPAIKAGGQWNTYEITARGDQITVVLNGVRTAFARDGKHPSGHIALQHGEDSVKNTALVKFRKVEIRSLAAAAGPAGRGY